MIKLRSAEARGHANMEIISVVLDVVEEGARSAGAETRLRKVKALAPDQAIGSAIARAALDSARARGLRVIPQCPFIRAYIERHPEYQDLTA